MFRRETIIALRARHTAFRMALEILHPPPPRPAAQTEADERSKPDPSEPHPPEAVSAIDVLGQFRAYERQRRRELRQHALRGWAILFWLAAGIVTVANWILWLTRE